MHLNKTSCTIWSIFDEVHFWVKNLTPFFHRSLHLTSYSILFESTINSEIPGSLIQFCIGAVVCAVCLGGREDAQKLNLTANCLNTFVTHYSKKLLIAHRGEMDPERPITAVMPTEEGWIPQLPKNAEIESH